MAKSQGVKHTYHVKLVGTKITYQKDSGKALELIFVPERTRQDEKR